MNNPASNMVINRDRLWNDLMDMADITEEGRPYTRRSFSEKFIEGRAHLDKIFKAAGLKTRIDENGNLIGRLEGRRPELGAIAIGSHSDTVPDGGRFDGVAGVISGLEVARALQNSGIELAHSIEIIDCLAEEMSEYGISCVGSRGLVGELEPSMLEYRGPNDELLRNAIDRVGGAFCDITQHPRTDIAAFLEMHIEQGRVLEDQGLDIGVVTDVVGITRIEIDVVGQPDHAGTTPMHMRSDALSLAAMLCLEIEAQAQRLAEAEGGYFVATTGEFNIEPNAANVVPGRVRMVIDARTDNADKRAVFIEAIKGASKEFATMSKAHVAEIRVLSDAASTKFDNQMIAHLQAASDDLGLKSIKMPSGAGHDAAFFSYIAPSAMIFVPCREGRSHCPEEYSTSDQIGAGADVLLNAVCAIDQELSSKKN